MDGEYYEVEKICKFKSKNGKRYYYIKWKNFPSNSNSWEPEENLTADLVAEYHRRVDNNNKKSSSTKRTNSVTSQQTQQHRRRRIVSCSTGVDESSDQTSTSNVSANCITPLPTEEELKNFQSIHQNRIPISVNGAVKFQRQLFHKMSFKDSQQDELIPARFSNNLWPSLVIEYYQKHMTLVK